MHTGDCEVTPAFVFSLCFRLLVIICLHLPCQSLGDSSLSLKIDIFFSFMAGLSSILRKLLRIRMKVRGFQHQITSRNLRRLNIARLNTKQVDY